MRHVFNFVVNECLNVEVNCNIANENLEELGVDLSFKNVNQMHHPLTTSLMPSKMHLYSSEYAINRDKIYCTYSLHCTVDINF